MDSNPPESLPYSMLLNCFGRVAIQIFRNERTHDFHMFMSSLLQVHSFIHIMVSLPSVNHSKYLSFSYLIWYMENFQDFYSVCSGWEQILKRCSHNRNKKHYENIITKQNGKIITEQKESLIFVPRILLYLILNGFDCLYVRIKHLRTWCSRDHTDGPEDK